jgi:Flp pilus assembly protein TadG
MTRRHARGQALIEFALVAPLLFFMLIGLIDLMRAVQAYSTVADAARQGARQAVANGAAADNPWGASNGQPCQGTSFSAGATGSGCLTDARIKETVNHVVQPLGGTVTLYSNTLAAACTTPTAGNISVCIAPAETGAGDPTDADCPSAKSRLGHDPQPGDLGSRNAEWTFPKFKGCFLVQVTVKYAFKAWTPYIPSLTLTSSTSMLGEEF